MNTLDKSNFISFKSKVSELFPDSKPEKIAVLPTTEYEGIFRNGGIGTYYKNLARRLDSQGWYVIIILGDFDSNYLGESDLPELKNIFSANQIDKTLNLSSFYQLILAQIQAQWVNKLGYSCLFFLEAILNYFPSSQIYVEFHEMLGIAYQTIQAKKSKILGDNCAIAVTMHSGHEWVFEANEKHNLEYPEWLWEVAYSEQSCFENADVSFFPSYYLTTRVKSYGWNIKKGHNMPNYIPIIADNLKTKEEIKDLLTKKYYHKAHLFLEQDNYTKAIENFRQVIKINPHVGDYYRDLGYALIHKNAYLHNSKQKEILIKKGHIDEAIACYQKAFELGFHDYFYWTSIFLADALTTMGRIEEAREYYQRALRLKIQENKPNFAEKYWDSGSICGPQFLIIGVAKSGTSSLYEYMIQHPQILSAAKKEIDFVDQINNGIDWYFSFFPPTSKKFITGEASTSYFGNFEGMKFFSEQFPQCKLIVMLRNPVDRVISHYYNDVKYAEEKRSLVEVVNDEIKFFQKISNLEDIANTNYWQTERGYLLTSIYVYYLKQWMSFFPKEQFLILNSEVFWLNPHSTLTDVFDFLELPDYQLLEYLQYNQGNYQKKGSSIEEKQVRIKLSKFFEPHNQKLENYLGVKFNWIDS